MVRKVYVLKPRNEARSGRTCSEYLSFDTVMTHGHDTVFVSRQRFSAVRKAEGSLVGIILINISRGDVLTGSGVEFARMVKMLAISVCLRTAGNE